MGNEEINVLYNRTRELANEIEAKAEESPYVRSVISNCLGDNMGGDAYNGMLDINANTEMCMNVAKQLVNCTATFLTAVARIWEQRDTTIAKEVKNS